MRRGGRRSRSAITPLGYSPAPTHRVLVLGDGEEGVPTAIEDLLARRLAEPGHGVDLDLVRSPAAALRVIAENPDSLRPYDAVVVISLRSTGRRQGDRILAAAPPAVGIPLLLVDLRVSAEDTDTAPLLPERATGATVLALLAETGPEVVATRIASSLHTMLAPPAPAAPPAVGRGPLDALAMRRLEQIARLTRDGLGTDAAEVDLISRDVVTAIATAGTAVGTHPRRDTLCALAVRSPGTSIVLDTRLDPATRGLGPVAGPKGIRFYAAQPIGSPTSGFLGVLCVWDRRPHRSADDLDLVLLRDLALLAEGEVADALRRSA